jgi:hypothetical protein
MVANTKNTVQYMYVLWRQVHMLTRAVAARFPRAFPAAEMIPNLLLNYEK